MKALSKKIMFPALMALTLASVVSVSMNSAHADYKRKTVSVDAYGRKVKIKEKVSYDLNGWQHVSKIKVKVKGDGYKYKAKIKVNGQDFFPVYDAGYLVYDVNQAVSRFDFWGDEIYDCDVDGIFFDAYDYGAPIRFRAGATFRGSIPEIQVRQIIASLDVLSYHSSLEEQIQFIRPIKILAGQALAKAYGRGEYSVKTLDAMTALVVQIDVAAAFFEEKLTVGATYDASTWLMSQREALADMLD